MNPDSDLPGIISRNPHVPSLASMTKNGLLAASPLPLHLSLSIFELGGSIPINSWLQHVAALTNGQDTNIGILPPDSEFRRNQQIC